MKDESSSSYAIYYKTNIIGCKDKRILNLSIDIRAAIKFLKEHEASGSRTIPYSWFVQFTMPRIQNKSEVIPKLKACAELRAEWNISELNKRTGISRQTFYNWDSHGYLVHTPKGKLDLRKTRIQLTIWSRHHSLSSSLGSNHISYSNDSVILKMHIPLHARSLSEASSSLFRRIKWPNLLSVRLYKGRTNG